MDGCWRNAAPEGVKMSEEKPAEMMVRCKNCIKRFPVEPGATRAKCPYCGVEYRISWPKPDLPYIRGLAE